MANEQARPIECFLGPKVYIECEMALPNLLLQQLVSQLEAFSHLNDGIRSALRDQDLRWKQVNSGHNFHCRKYNTKAHLFNSAAP